MSLLRVSACAVAEVALFDAGAQRLDGVAGQGFACQHHFQAVVVGRIVAAGDHHRAVGVELEGGEIHHRGGDAAHVDDVDAALLDAARQRCGKFHAGQAPVAADGDGVLAARGGFRADGVAYAFNDFGGEGFADDAADVVGLENFFGQSGHDV